MTDIVTVTLNPAVDVATSFEQVTDTRKLRCSAARRDPGGDGINVARVAQRPGGDCVALYLCGGATGQMLQQLLDTERVAGLRIEIAGETRENFSVQETSTGREYRFVLPGPTVARHEWQRYIDHVGALEVQPRYLVMSGSLPPGSALAAALEAGVWLVKPSLNELRGLTGQPLVSESEWLASA